MCQNDRIANSADPDPLEQFDLGLHCLFRQSGPFPLPLFPTLICLYIFRQMHDIQKIKSSILLHSLIAIQGQITNAIQEIFYLNKCMTYLSLLFLRPQKSVKFRSMPEDFLK